jgi:exonuclease VII small subunit
MALGFSLQEMQSTLEIANEQTEKYSEAIDTLDSCMTELETVLKSNEIKLYEDIMEIYNSKKQELVNAREQMKVFCNTINQKILELDDAADSARANFS